MLKVLNALADGWSVEVIRVTKAEHPHCRRTMAIDPTRKIRQPVDPRSIRALLKEGQITGHYNGVVGAPPNTHYSITEAGRERLRLNEWR